MTDRHTEEAFLKIRRNLINQSDDETIERLPPMIILGETEERSFDRKHFTLKLTFSSPSVLTEHGYLLVPDEEESLREVARELGIKNELCGLYVSERTPLLNFVPFTCTHQRLVMIKPFQEGFLLLQ